MTNYKNANKLLSTMGLEELAKTFYKKTGEVLIALSPLAFPLVLACIAPQKDVSANNNSQERIESYGFKKDDFSGIYNALEKQTKADLSYLLNIKSNFIDSYRSLLDSIGSVTYHLKDSLFVKSPSEIFKNKKEAHSTDMSIITAALADKFGLDYAVFIYSPSGSKKQMGILLPESSMANYLKDNEYAVVRVNIDGKTFVPLAFGLDYVEKFGSDEKVLYGLEYGAEKFTNKSLVLGSGYGKEGTIRYVFPTIITSSGRVIESHPRNRTPEEAKNEKGFIPNYFDF